MTHDDSDPWERASGEVPFSHPCRYDFAHRGQRPAEGWPLVVALHGMGMSGAGFLRVLRHLPGPRAILAPDGPFPFEQRDGASMRVGHAWYIYRGDQAEFRAHLVRSEAHVLELLARVQRLHPIDARRVVLLGFSQGGYLAGFTGLRHPERFPGLVIASSRLKHEFLEGELARGGLPHTLFLHGRDDAAIPWQRAQEGVDRLLAQGGSAELALHDEGHRLPRTALETLAAWLERKGLAC